MDDKLSCRSSTDWTPRSKAIVSALQFRPTDRMDVMARLQTFLTGSSSSFDGGHSASPYSIVDRAKARISFADIAGWMPCPLQPALDRNDIAFIAFPESLLQ